MLLPLLLLSGLACADTPAVDEDGFTHPLRNLEFNPGLDQREFERATFQALDVYDPFESVNRRIYHFNYRLDQWVMLPVVRGYRYVTPQPVRTGVSNFFANLGEIPTLFNSVAQLKGQRAANATARFLFNSILGVGGLWDPATRMGLVRQSEDFGQTLGYWGVPQGPYLIIPALGPSNLRDATGRVTDFAVERQVELPPVLRDHRWRAEPDRVARHQRPTRHQLPLRPAELAVRVREGALCLQPCERPHGEGMIQSIDWIER